MTMFLAGPWMLLRNTDQPSSSMILSLSASFPQSLALIVFTSIPQNFSVNGEYDPDFNTGEIEITYGYPKDGRWDLKRFILGMASNQHGVPLSPNLFVKRIGQRDDPDDCGSSYEQSQIERKGLPCGRFRFLNRRKSPFG